MEKQWRLTPLESEECSEACLKSKAKKLNVGRGITATLSE